MKLPMCSLSLSLVISSIALLPALAAAQPCTPEWSALPFKGFNGIPQALAVFNDGSGESLYAGGYFDLAGGTPAYIARWDGQAWQSLGGGLDYYVQALLVFDDGAGGGRALYAAGDFTTADGQPSRGVARWDGHVWSPLPYDGGTVYALAAFDDGNGRGPALYLGDSAGVVVRWNGSEWFPLRNLDSSVYTLAAFDDGNGRGPALYAGGRFAGVFRWDGSSWNTAGSINDRVYVLHVFDDGQPGGGPARYAGGSFDTADGNPASRMASWNGQTWSPLGPGVDGEVHSMTVFDDGQRGGGSALYVGGTFFNAGKVPTPYIARWNGLEWSALDGGTNNLVQSLVGFEADPLGPSLYAGGDFANAGSVLAGRIARWGCNGPACSADFNNDGAVNSQDYFDFLAAFFSDHPSADFNHNGTINSQDFFDFLAAFFAGC